jgi:hypothetical protein
MRLLREKTFRPDEEMEEAVDEWLRMKPKGFFYEESRH